MGQFILLRESFYNEAALENGDDHMVFSLNIFFSLFDFYVCIL